MQIFIPIRSAGASPEIGEIYGIVTFFLVGWLVGYSVFFSGTHIARTRVQICTVYGSYDVFSPKDGPRNRVANFRTGSYGSYVKSLTSIQPKWHKNSKY